MVRITFTALALGLVASLGYYWALASEESLTGSSRIVAPKIISTSYQADNGPNWTAALTFSNDGQLRQVQLGCNGQPYMTVPAGSDFPSDAVGAYLDVYPDTTCSKGDVELTVVTLPKGSMIDVPGIFIPVRFSFKDGRYFVRNVGRLEELPRAHIEKYCPKGK